jgi:nucleoside-diphosphate-sugar epimerase
MILVSGANGFLGQAICGLFADQAVGIVRAAAPDSAQKQLVCDLSDPSFSEEVLEELKAEKFSCLVHCAGVTPWGTDPNFELDLVMAKNALTICKKLGVPKLVFTSGWIVYDVNASAPYKEDSTPLQPSTDYGKSKLATENYLKENAGDITVVNLRLASIYGPGQTTAGLIPNLVKTALSGQSISINSKETKRDYLYIDDLLNVIKNVEQLELTENLDLNVGSGQSLRIIDVANAVQATVVEKYDIAIDVELKEPLSEGVPADNTLDITKAQELALLERTTDFKTGIAAYIDWAKHEVIS